MAIGTDRDAIELGITKTDESSSSGAYPQRDSELLKNAFHHQQIQHGRPNPEFGDDDTDAYRNLYDEQRFEGLSATVEDQPPGAPPGGAIVVTGSPAPSGILGFVKEHWPLLAAGGVALLIFGGGSGTKRLGAHDDDEDQDDEQDDFDD